MTLKIKQLDLFSPTTTPASSIPAGSLFLYGNTICMRIKPVAYLLNSALIQDKLAKGYVMYVAIETGKCSWLKGEAVVEPIIGKLEWSK